MLNSPGLLDSISSSFEGLVRLEKIVWLIVELWIWCSIQFRYNWEIYWLSTEGCGNKFSLNYLKLLSFRSIYWNIYWYYWMCESEPAILSAAIVLLTVITLLLVYLLTEKICLWEINSSSLPDTKFLQFT